MTRHATCWTWLTVTVAATAGVYVFSLAYVSLGANFVEGLEQNLGEVLMREGGRLEQAQQYEAAIETYRRALAQNFRGPHNEAHVLKRLGTLLWQRQDWEEAAAVLRRAQAHPAHDAGVYLPLVDSLYHMGALDEAAARIADWEAMAESAPPETTALRLYHAGRIEAAQGDTETAVKDWRTAAALHPRGLGAYALGLHLFEQGEVAAALPHLRAYAGRNTGAQAANARAIVEQLSDEGQQ